MEKLSSRMIRKMTENQQLFFYRSKNTKIKLKALCKIIIQYIPFD